VVRGGGEELAISVTFWKMSANVSAEEAAKVAVNLMEKGLFPPKDTKILGFYICPGGRGVTISESTSADSAGAVENWLNWVRDRKDFFECYEVHPAVPIEDAIKMALGK
jgi:hypothetical protein